MITEEQRIIRLIYFRHSIAYRVAIAAQYMYLQGTYDIDLLPVLQNQRQRSFAHYF